MSLTRRSVVLMTLTLSCVLLVPSRVRGQPKVEIYPGPGVDTYKSNLYKVEVFDGAAWIPTYVYKFTRRSVCHWHYGTFPSVNFVTFGTIGSVDVRVTKLSGTITSLDVSPHSKHVPGRLTGGQAIGTLEPNAKLWLTIDGDDANPLFIFADAPKPPVPPGARYFGPGVRDISPATGNHYKPVNDEIIYLDGGAWVRGNIDVSGTRNVRIMGPGVLSGDLWRGEDLLSLPYDQQVLYSMVKGDSAGDAASVSGITIVDGPTNGIWGGANKVSGVKMLSPWFYGTDAFPFVSHIDHTFCFAGDEVFMPAFAGYQGEDMTITSCFAGTSNNTVFAGGWWGFESKKGYSTLVDDIDIKTYNNDDWVPSAPLLASAFQVWLDNSVPSAGYSNQTYQNVRIEGNLPGPLLSLKHTVYPWGGPYAVNPPLGNASNITFKNISLEGTQKYRSEIKGQDANNGFHNVVLDNVAFGGEVVTPANLARYFDVNAYVSGLSFRAGDICTPDATTLCLNHGRFRVRASYDSAAATGDGSAVGLTTDTGYFWFFSPSNVEIVVKVINGCGVNANYWVFAGGLTDVGVTLTVSDTQTGVTRSYRNVRGTAFLPLQRTADFGVCGAAPALAALSTAAAGDSWTGPSGGRSAPALVWQEPLPRSEARAAEKVAAAGVCVANATTLCLTGGRFQVRASYDTDSGSGEGNGVALTTDTGYFWFFSPSNVEMVVKVVNGCVVNQSYWTFAGGLTDVGVTLSITDMQSGISKSYANPRHTPFAPIQRTADLAVCP